MGTEHDEFLRATMGCMDLVYNLARRMVLSPEDAQDLVQETYLAALRAYPRFDGANPRAWLLTIARNKALDAIRADARRPGALPDPDAIPSGQPAVDDPAGGEVWESVAGLPPKQREAVLLRFAADLRYREIGLTMDCSEAAARRSVHEGITKLRESSETEKETRR